ncbi:1-acyl-sn-glycerol-3-phosphate acyltransferase [Schaalia suimastitidis]|uniref:1-acyl-sn-glycerol-3-phosphate acyltransferase n=1 Tax=Schaalia suimastitidis TaxID=121163 RepID=UPI0003F96F47|nr:1-acyl-sn-glycerol-3-phosphate acyltransferase [Schaalia suimastitidis]
MRIRKAIACTFLRLSRWSFSHEPLPDQVIVIGAPHTSNWDGVFMAVAFWSLGRPFCFLVKDSLVKAPVLGPFIRWVGGIGVDRSRGNGIVEAVARMADQARARGETFTIAITPKGTRSPRPYWKSGFYRIAREADIPIQLGFVDRNSMSFGWGPTVHLTGDTKADMDVIRRFYAPMAGVRADKTSVPRLRMEDDESQA